jgi:hypothetical protein
VASDCSSAARGLTSSGTQSPSRPHRGDPSRFFSGCLVWAGAKPSSTGRDPSSSRGSSQPSAAAPVPSCGQASRRMITCGVRREGLCLAGVRTACACGSPSQTAPPASGGRRPIAARQSRGSQPVSSHSASCCALYSTNQHRPVGVRQQGAGTPTAAAPRPGRRAAPAPPSPPRSGRPRRHPHPAPHTTLATTPRPPFAIHPTTPGRVRSLPRPDGGRDPQRPAS